MRPIRILHVLGGMNRGGVETWLTQVLRTIDRRRFEMHFLVHTDKPCAYDEEVVALGGKIIPCPHPKRPWRYARHFLRILSEHGPYDVVHSHVHHYSGFVLAFAWLARVPVRIAHSHSDRRSVVADTRAVRRIYLGLMKRYIRRYATVGLACSHGAACDLFGTNWRQDPRWRVLHCGIELSPFQQPVDRWALRRELRLPPDAIVVGHVGRFGPPKNHLFLVEALAEAMRADKRVYALLIGDGAMRPAIERRLNDLGVANRVVLTGIRSDVPRLMRGAMDMYVFPSCYEGLPLVLVEAQAAGLPCLVSDRVPDEAGLVKPLIRRLPLESGPHKWAEEILKVAGEPLPVDHRSAFDAVERSSFNINASLRSLQDFYDSTVTRTETPVGARQITSPEQGSRLI